ncbi:hypothetical protein D3D02_02685 [Halobellus sp. Atlit-38R]|jgi:hypothetical protein|uniref:DUF7094 domain-containing protein n=1 Tax=Halobellus sp. Atlit-38R TaxID=2282131 RepID=UPI000EF27D3A|nr:hypothetical protein [Halobellus sp. Atlit-38R]RLM90697.1 hypothetical protein D3D02_02685 [Halobellus sp. Atlit-38R]
MRAVSLSLALLLVLSAVVGAVPALSDADGASAPSVDGSTPSASSVSAPVPSAAQPTERLGPGSGTPAQVVDSNASEAQINVLGIPSAESTRSTLETEYVELGSGLAFSSATTDAHLATATAVERIESAETTEARQRYLLQEVSAIEQRVVALRARQQQAVAAYGRDELPPRRFLYELALIDAEARELEQRRDRLESLARSTPGFSISSARFGNIGLELNTLSGPVRGYAGSVLRGEAASARFYVQTGADSVTLSVIRDGTYVRETYRGALRQGDSSGPFSLAEAVNATEQAYPTIAALRLRDDTLGNPDSDSTRVTIEHQRGRLVAFVDSESQRVFEEYQYRPLDQVRTGSSTSAVKDALNLTAHRTYPGGPVRLQLNSTTTGDPVDAQITVGPAGGRSSVVGRTGEDGSLWTLAPSGTYQVTAIDGSSVVLLSVEPTATPSVYGPVNNSTGTDGTATTSGF